MTMASARARGLRGLLAVAVLLLATGASQGAGCNTEGSTVLASKQCDGIKNCDNGMDEEGCSYPEDCRGGAVFCDGRCLPAASRCDRVIWCSNGADEKGCPWWP
ncbi:hypothetical protein FOCC_FOCC009606, partial [Frankliniella occidentalis]